MWASTDRPPCYSSTFPSVPLQTGLNACPVASILAPHVVVSLLAAALASGCRQDALPRHTLRRPHRRPARSLAALAAQARYTDRLLAIPGVVGTGVGMTATGRAAVKVFTRGPGVGGVPVSLDGVPAEILITGEIRAIPATRPAADPAVVVSPEDHPSRPVPIGVSTGNEGTCSAGTIGARVKAGNKVYALSNNHVYALENRAPLGSRILQPGRYDLNCAGGTDGVMGSLTKFVPIDFSSGAANVEMPRSRSPAPRSLVGAPPWTGTASQPLPR